MLDSGYISNIGSRSSLSSPKSGCIFGTEIVANSMPLSEKLAVEMD